MAVAEEVAEEEEAAAAAGRRDASARVPVRRRRAGRPVRGAAATTIAHRTAPLLFATGTLL